MKSLSSKDIRDASIDQIATYFLSLVIWVASVFYIPMAFKIEGAGLTVSMLFYILVPISLSLIIYQTFRTVKILYSQWVYHDYDTLSTSVLGLVIGVATLNLGFITVLTSGPSMISGEAGLYKFVMLTVILSFTLSVSVLNEQIPDIERDD